MAVEMVLLLVLVSAYLGNSEDGGISVHCDPAVGVVGGPTEISCSFKKRFTGSINISAVIVNKSGATGPVFWINSWGDRGDPRFKLPSREDPSLQITNTALSDEGLYEYEVRTDRGSASVTFRISVTETISVDCQPADGVVGQTTNISCSFGKNFTGSITITAVRVTKRGERDPVFWISDGKVQRDPRFDLPSRENPSLQITNTALSDEGRYDYEVLTDRGSASGAFWIRVTGFKIIYIITAGVVIAVLIIVGLLLVFLYHRRCSQSRSQQHTERMTVIRASPGKPHTGKELLRETHQPGGGVLTRSAAPSGSVVCLKPVIKPAV